MICIKQSSFFGILSVLIFLFSCKEKNNQYASTSPRIVLSDSTYTHCNDSTQLLTYPIAEKGLFEVDDYSIPFELLKSSYRKMKIDSFFTADQAWFANDIIKQVLVISIATDLHKMSLFHFSYNEFPNCLLSELHLYKTNEADLVDSSQKFNILPFFIDSAVKTTASYFKTVKGFSLGDCKEKAIKTYGIPDSTISLGEIDKISWVYDGDKFYLNSKLPNKPIAKNSFGHSVTMYFRKNRLVGQYLFNDIP
jgi:hypothetical protein